MGLKDYRPRADRVLQFDNARVINLENWLAQHSTVYYSAKHETTPSSRQM